MKVRCAIFDFDGTLFDSMPVWDTASSIYLRSQGVEPHPDVAETIRAMSLPQAARYFQEEYGLDLPVDQIVAGVDQVIERAYLHEVQPKPGAAAFVSRLRETGAATCSATATDRHLIEGALRRCGMDGLFDAIFTCTEVGYSKTRPDIFRAAMGAFEADRGDTVVFEDAVHAIRTAAGDGFVTVAIRDAGEPHHDEIGRLSACYLEDFEHAEEFWEHVLD